MRLLRFAVDRNDYLSVSSLCGLACASQIDAADVAELLQQALRIVLAGGTSQACCAAEVVTALCSLESARWQLDAAAVGQLLRDAVLAHSSKATAALCKLLDAAQTPADVMDDLLQLAAKAGDAAVTEALLMHA